MTNLEGRVLLRRQAVDPPDGVRTDLETIHKLAARLDAGEFFCSNAIEAGCDFKVIAEWLGHKDGGVLVAMTYGHLRGEHSAAMARRLTFDADADESIGQKIVKLGEL